MSKTIDERVVQLGFDNKQFEGNVKTSLDSLDKLKKGLNLDESARSLTHLANVSKAFSLASIADGVDNISSKFSALGAIGFTILQNLTNAAIQYGKKLFNSLTAPMKTGLAEYETQINAIQTVLANTASKGTTLDDVNKALDTLNTYADKTIYNFTEMTRNIGTFTAAGIDLETSTSAIKGIANLAAISGSNSQQASTAMYQLSQALASGTVKLMDWNSVVNAGMGGQVFQDALKETARLHKVKIDEMIKREGSFRETLQNGWLTSEILTETLAKFTGDLTASQLQTMGYTEDQIEGILKLGETANDAATKVKTFSQLKETLQEALQSGWSQSWRLVIGDFEEARGFFTEVSDVFGGLISESSDARNKILRDWRKFGGRDAFIQALRNTFDGVNSIIAPVKEAFKDIFPREMLEGQRLKLITFAIRDFTEKLKIGGETADKLKRIFKGLFAGLDIVKRLVLSLFGVFSNLAKSMVPLGDGVLDFLANIGDYIVGLRDVIKANDTFNVAIQKIPVFLEQARKTVIKFASDVKEKFNSVKERLSGLFKDVDTGAAGDFFGKIFDRLKDRFEPLKKLLEGIDLQFEPLKAISKVVGAILSKMASIFVKALPIFFKFASGVGSFIGDIGIAIANGIGELQVDKIFDLINSGLIAGILLAVRNFINKGSGALDGVSGVINNFSGIFSGVTEVLNGVRGSLEAWQQSLKAKTLLTIAGAIAILTLSLIALSGIDSKKLTMALGAVTAMFAQLMGSMAIYSKISGPTGGLGFVASLMALSIAVLIMSAAVANLSRLKPEELNRGLLAVAALTVGIVGFSQTLSSSSGELLKSAAGLILFSISLNILSGVVEKIGSLDPYKIQNGLIGIGALLAELAIFMKLNNMDKMGVLKGTGLLLLAGAIMVLSIAVEKLGNMKVDVLQRGLITIGGVLTELALFVQLTGDSKKVITTAIGMTILGGAMLIFAEVLTRMGNLTWEEISRGMVVMAGALTIIFAAVKLMPKDMILTGVALVVVASSLVILSQALSTMGNMTWDEIARGLTALAGALTILTIGLYAMQGTLGGAAALIIVSGALAILAPALKMFGAMSLAEIGSGLLVLAGTFAVLGIAGYLLTPVVPTLLGLAGSILLLGIAVAAIGLGVLAFSAGLAALAVSGVAGATALVAIIATILGVVPLIVKSFGDALLLLLQIIIELGPVLGEAIKVILLELIEIIVEVTPPLLVALETLLLQLLATIRNVVPDFIKTVQFLLLSLLETTAKNMPRFIKAGMDIILSFLKGIRDNIAEIVTVAYEIVTEFLDAVAKKIPDVIDSGFNLIISFINGLADSIRKNASLVNAAVGNLAQAIVDGLCDGLTNGVSGVVAAIRKLTGAAINALKTLLGIFSPSRVTTELGEDTGEGFANGIVAMAVNVKRAAEKLGTKAVSTMSGAVNKIAEALESDIDLSPNIRPVIDLTGVISGSKQIDNIFGKKTLNVATTIGKVSSVSSNMIPEKELVSDQKSTDDSGVTFIQNNYSPTALSRLEIYRQTKNQLFGAKGLVPST